MRTSTLEISNLPFIKTKRFIMRTSLLALAIFIGVAIGNVLLITGTTEVEGNWGPSGTTVTIKGYSDRVHFEFFYSCLSDGESGSITSSRFTLGNNSPQFHEQHHREGCPDDNYFSAGSRLGWALAKLVTNDAIKGAIALRALKFFIKGY